MIIKLFDYGSVVMPSSPDMINRVNALLSSMYSNIMLFEIDSMKNGLMKDLTFHEVHTIEIIGDLERPTMSQISRKANVTQSTMSTMVNKLAKKGMIQRHPNRNDRRVVNITLTERGKRAYKEHQEIHRRVTRFWFGLLDDDEQKFLLKIMGKINSAASR